MALPYVDDEDDVVTKTTPSSNINNLPFIDDEEEVDTEQLSTTSTLPFIDDDEDMAVEDTSSAAIPVVEQPAPEGYEYKNIPITKSDGTPGIERKLVSTTPDEQPREDAFTYEETAKATSQLGLDVLDTLTLYDNELHNVFGEEFTVTYIPEYLRPFVRTVGKTVDGILVKPFTEVIPGTAQDLTRTALGVGNVGLKALKETTEGFGMALTRAVQDNITSESDALKTMQSIPGSAGIILGTAQQGLKTLGVEGKDILPFDPKTAGRKFTSDLAMAAEVEMGLPITTALRANKAISQPLEETVGATNRLRQKRNDLATKRIRIDEAMENAATVRASRKREAAKIIRDRDKEANTVAKELIDEVENNLLDGQSISRVTDDGRVVLDFEKGVELGRKKIDSLVDDVAEEGQQIIGTDNKILHPILDPEKFEPVVAVLVTLKDRFPTAFKQQKHLSGPFKGQKFTFGQQLLKLVNSGDDKVVKELNEVFSEYGLNAADLATMVLSSDRIAGQTLRARRTTLEQLRNRDGSLTPAGKIDKEQTKRQSEFDAAVENMGTFTRNIKRGENIMLGALTGTVATAMRNLESYIVRSPMEGLINVMETAVIQAGKKRQAKRDEAFVGPPEARPTLTDDQLAVAATRNPYATSLETLSNVFDVTSGKDQQRLIDYVLKRNDFDKFYKKLYGNIDELQLGYGRGEGKFGDKTLSGLEDLVQVLNAPNRWQEFHIRNGTFIGEIQNQVQREWGINFIEAINKGLIDDILNDATKLRPKGAKSFVDIVTESTEKALEVTYAARPRSKLGARAVDFARQTPLASLIIAFPRFMLKAMEYLGQTTAGIPFVYARKYTVGGGKSASTDREIIQRNLAGLVGIGAATHYRMSEDAPADLTKIRTPDGNELDTKPIIPLPQALWIGEAIKQTVRPDGDFTDFWNGGGGKLFFQLFTGTNFKAGQALGPAVTSVFDTLGGMSVNDGERAGKIVGNFTGSILFRPFRPLAQAVDLERTLGGRPLEFRSFSSDPVMGFGPAFIKGAGKQFKTQGLSMSGAEEATYPRKPIPFNDAGRSRVGPAYRLLGGLTIQTPNDEVQEWIINKNFRQEYLFEGRTGIDTVDDAITETFNALAVPVVETLMASEKVALKNANTRAEKREIYKNGRATFDEFIKKVKSSIGSVKYKRAAVDEEGVRTSGTFRPEYVMALARARRLSKTAFERGVTKYKAAKKIKPGELLDFSNPDVLNGIAIAGEMWVTSTRNALDLSMGMK